VQVLTNNIGNNVIIIANADNSYRSKSGHPEAYGTYD